MGQSEASTIARPGHQAPASCQPATENNSGNRPAPLGDAEFKRLLVSVIPHLRAFGHSLSGSMDTADDLTQETLVKAWAARKRFIPDTSMRAWTFVILRNTFLSQMRRRKFTGDYDELMAERMLSAPADQQQPLHLIDLQRAMHELSVEQREALILIAAGGFSYEEAALISGCAVGTIKSRVSRARDALVALLDGGSLRKGRADSQISAGDKVLADLLSQVASIAQSDVSARLPA